MKAKDELILHSYNSIQFLIVLQDGKTAAERLKGKKAHVRYNSPLGKFVIHTFITTTHMAVIGDWQGYLCGVCLAAYEKAKGKREQDLATGTGSAKPKQRKQ